MVMKIDNMYGEANTFTFPHNPESFDDPIELNHAVTPIPFTSQFIMVSAGGMNPKQLVLQGHFDDATSNDKLADYRSLAEHFRDSTKLKRLYFESDKFYLGFGMQIKKVHTGGRTGFVDYVASFMAGFGVLFGTTLRTSANNAGNTASIVERVVGTVVDGGVDVTVTDFYGNVWTVGNASLSTGVKLHIQFIRMFDSGSGVFVSESPWLGLHQDTGTTDSTTADKLVQSGQNFLTTVAVGDVVHNTTDDSYASVTAVDSDTVLSLSDDIMVSGESFVIYRLTRALLVTSGLGLLKIPSGSGASTVTTTNLSGVTVSYRDAYTA